MPANSDDKELSLRPNQRRNSPDRDNRQREQDAATKLETVAEL